MKNTKEEKTTLAPHARAGSRSEKTPESRSSAQRFLDGMGLGFNLGNSLDAVPRPGSEFAGIDSELAWHNPRTTREMIRAVRAAGFGTLRLPVTWHPHVSGEGDRIDPVWMARVREIVSWGLAEGMYVVLNTHHEIREGFLLPDDAHLARAEEFLRNVWSQIAEAFRDEGERLLFEPMNEIRIPGTPYEWTPDPEDPDCRRAMEHVNRLNQVFLDTVRAAGGGNAERYLILPGYSTSTEGLIWDGFRLPREEIAGRLMVSAHVYSPAHFTFLLERGEDIRTFDPGDPASTDPIDERLCALYEKFGARGIPVTMNEFGTVDKDNDADRVRCLAYTVSKARSLGIQCCYWDNGQFGRYGSAMGIFDREKCVFPSMEPVRAMLGEGSEGKC